MFTEKFEEFRLENPTKKHIVTKMSEFFKVSPREIHKRMRSYCGKSIDDILEPTKDQMVYAILQADNIDDLKAALGIRNGLGRLYEKYFGTSTFASARKVVESTKVIPPYNHSLDDNFSILASQRLGDGHLNVSRRALDIQHSEKQFEYLAEKVKMINKAFPDTAPVGSIKKYRHAQGHIYYRYWSGPIASSTYRNVSECELHTLVPKLTPLGVFLWYMDDGCLKDGTNITIAIADEKTRNELVTLLRSYGIQSSPEDTQVRIGGVVAVSNFLNTFVKPFNTYIPDCMGYKSKLMI